MESDLSNKVDAIINGTYFEKIRNEFEYCMGHPESKKQVIQVMINNRKNNVFWNMIFVNLNSSTNTKNMTDKKADDEVDTATTN